MDRLLDTLFGTESYAERRGAAFGLAGVVKGLGIPTLKSLGIMIKLQEAVESKAKGEATVNSREGALQAYLLGVHTYTYPCYTEALHAYPTIRA